MSTSQSPRVIRTERGLTISSTRITLYDVLSYLHAGQSPEQLRESLPLTDQQIQTALDYISIHRDAVEAEYQRVLHDAAEARRYWEERNRDHLAQIAANPTPGTEMLRAELAKRRADRAERQSAPTSS